VSKDSKVQFIPAKQVYTVASDPVQNRYYINLAKDDQKIFVPDNAENDEEIRLAKELINMVGVGINAEIGYKINSNSNNDTLVSYPDLSRVRSEYSSDNLRKVSILLAQLYLKTSKDESQQYIQSIVHEKEHLDNLRNNDDEILLIARKQDVAANYFIEHHQDMRFKDKYSVLKLLKLSRSNFYQTLLLKEPRAEIAEVQRIVALKLSTNLVTDYRILELITSIIEEKSSKTCVLDHCLQEDDNLDDHVTGDILLFWGPDYFVDNTNSYVNWNKMVHDSKNYQDFENGVITLREAVVLAIVDKAKEHIEGKNILITPEQTQELDKMLENCWTDKIVSVKNNLEKINQLIPQIRLGEEAIAK